MAGDDDEFGLSSGDEAELIELEKMVPLNKRSCDDDTDGHASKKARNNGSASATAIRIANQVLKQHFRISSFRLKQEAAIARLLDGGSAVVVFPTGGGKSLCYQVPALGFKEMDRIAGIRQGPAESGITIVVSPLIALMKDQVDALHRKGIEAAVMDSTKTKDEYLATVDALSNGTLDILYCAPERLNNEGFLTSMANVKGGVRLLAVDEAHCISEWGHAFRPDYLKGFSSLRNNYARVLTIDSGSICQRDQCGESGMPDCYCHASCSQGCLQSIRHRRCWSFQDVHISIKPQAQGSIVPDQE